MQARRSGQHEQKTHGEPPLAPQGAAEEDNQTVNSAGAHARRVLNQRSRIILPIMPRQTATHGKRAHTNAAAATVKHVDTRSETV